MAKRTKRTAAKSVAQLEREIKSVATGSETTGGSLPVSLFSDPAATRMFVREMRHELQKRQAFERTAATLTARPFEVRRMEDGRRALFSRYPNEREARQVADRIGGWVERDGRVI